MDEIKTFSPNWDEYFIGLAFMVSARSKDAQTKHGCVLVDENNHIISTGYNSFARGLTDHKIPNVRPDKYKYLTVGLHSEKNAIYNSTISFSPATKKIIAYVTGRPCYDCLVAMWQCGISNVIYADAYGWQADKEEDDKWNEFVEMTGMNVSLRKVDLSWMHNVMDRIKQKGLL